VHGGMGFIEETGAAQYCRDVRITTIYEGTTGIQANDLVLRKIGRDRGGVMKALTQELRAELGLVAPDSAAGPIAAAALRGLGLLDEATDDLLGLLEARPAEGLGIAVPFLKLAGTVLGGALMARAAAIGARALDGATSEREFYAAKIQTARFLAQNLLPAALHLAAVVRGGGPSIDGADPALF